MKHILPSLILSLGLVLVPLSATAQDATEAEPPATSETSTAEEQATAEAESPITALLEAFIVNLVEDGDGNMVEELVVATRAEPGDTILYRTTYTNVSDASLAGLVANAPIPAGTTYLADTASISAEAVFEVLIENEDWQELPAFKTIVDENGEEQRVEAGPADYIQLRWRVTEALEPEGSIGTDYRVTINN